MDSRAKFHFDKLYPSEFSVTGEYIILQIGDLNCEPGYGFPLHIQTMHEISYIVSGKGEFICNGHSYQVKRGDLIINREGEEHTLYSSMIDPMRYMYLGFKFKQPFSTPVMEPLANFFNHPGPEYCAEAFDVQSAFVRLLDEEISSDSFSELIKNCCVTELLCQIYRLMSHEKRKVYQISAGQHVDVQMLVYDIAHYLDNNVGLLKNLTVLSEKFGYSYTYLSKIFLSNMGETLHSYYNKKRFEKAREYIRNGTSITDTAQLVGFQSIHAFSRAYKKYFGTCPRDTMKE